MRNSQSGEREAEIEEALLDPGEREEEIEDW